MALTQVSSKGIKDATLLNEDVNASANIAGSKLADNSISLAKLLHGDANSDGKFLRANNGADPTFETITGTTINNQGDNRLITATGTTDTLNSESNLTFDGTQLSLTGNIYATQSASSLTTPLRVHNGTSDTNANTRLLVSTAANGGGDPYVMFDAGGSNFVIGNRYAGTTNNILCIGEGSDVQTVNGMFIKADGKVGIGATNPGSICEIKYSDSSTSISSQVPQGLRINNTDNTLGRLSGLYFTHGGGGSANIGLFSVSKDTATASTNAGSDLAFYTKKNGQSNMSESMRIVASGNVGIGTTSPDQKLKIEDSSNIAIHLLKTGSQDTLLKNTGQTELCAATGGASGQRIVFKIGANTGSLSDIARFTPDGLCFGTDTATANALDEYEEGTWTPTINTGYSAGYAYQYGAYTRVGQLVYFNFYIQLNSLSGSNSQGSYGVINGLPFTSTYNNMLGWGSASIPWIYNLGQDITHCYVDQNSTVLQLLTLPSSGDRSHSSPGSLWTSTGRIAGGGVYQTG